MPAPTVPYKILAKGYRVRGGQDGLHATVPCIVNWSDAFVFHDDVLGYPRGLKGSIVYQIPWRFPGAPFAPMYAISCDIEPIGAGGTALPAPYGVVPGEFFPNAICTVEFATREFMQVASDGYGNQLDPSQPIAFCTQRVRGGAKMVTRKGVGYKYSATGKPVIGDLGVVEPECHLVLEYPCVPFQPWTSIQAYVGKINSIAMLGCGVATLLFEEFDTEATATTQGLMGQKVTYSFAWSPNSWNTISGPTGAVVAVERNDGSGTGIYEEADLRVLFL